MGTDNRSFQSKEKIESLQVLRAVAFLFIFLYHVLGIPQTGGVCGVSIFLVLSGFVMMYNYIDRKINISFKNVILFAVGKIRKLYPLYLITMFVGFCIFQYHFNGDFIKKLFLSIFLIQSWFSDGSIYFFGNGVAWYLSVCLFTYMTFPFVLKFLQRNCSVMTHIKYMMITFVIQILCGLILKQWELDKSFIDWCTYINPLFRTGDFFIGCNLGCIFLRCKKNISSKICTIVEIFIFLCVVILEILNRKSLTISSVYYLPLSVLFVYFFAVGKGLVSKILYNKFFIFLGNISGYTFLIHQVIELYLYQKNEQMKLSVIIVVPLIFCITVILSIIYIHISKVIHLKRKSVKQKKKLS